MSRVMMDSEVYLENFHGLVERHRDSYRRHIVDVVERHEHQIAKLLRNIHDVDLEHASWLGPALAARREKLQALRAKAARVAHERDRESTLARLAERLEQIERREREREAERSQLMASLDALDRDRQAERSQLMASLDALDRDRQAERTRLVTELDMGLKRIAELDTARANALRRLEELHASMSWRVTAPLRAAYTWLLRLRGRSM
jgi:hypothetical protein